MSVFRVNKTKDYVTMSKTHLKEKNMSLKAKGLLSEMLGLPNEWDYSINGLVSINKENESAIKSTLAELKEFGYLKVTKLLPNATTSGRIEYIYDIYENPLQEGKKQEVENQPLENQPLEIQSVENPTQLNNKELSIKELNNKELKRGKKFVKPTLEQIKEYCLERNNNVDSERFFNYYEANGWVQGKSRKPIKDWKACIRTWEQNEKKKDNPSWFNTEVTKEEMTEEELEELRKELNL